MWGFGQMNKAGCSTTQYRPSSSKHNNPIELHTTFDLCHPHPETMRSVMNALTSVQLSMAQYHMHLILVQWNTEFLIGYCMIDSGYIETPALPALQGSSISEYEAVC